jgi:nitroreductase
MDRIACLDGLLGGRRSVRRYQPQAIGPDELAAVLRAATLAPSNFNRQPWAFYVLDDEASRAGVLQLLRGVLAQAERNDTRRELSQMLQHVRRWLYPLDESPTLVLAFYKPTPDRFDQVVSKVLGTGEAAAYNPDLFSLGMAVQNLLLAAHARGLGACMHSGPVPFLRGEVNRALGLPPNLQLAGVVSLGYPAEAPPAPHRRPLARCVHFVRGAVGAGGPGEPSAP